MKKVKVAVELTKASLFQEWMKAEMLTEREQVHAKLMALDDLQFSIINSIRGNKDE